MRPDRLAGSRPTLLLLTATLLASWPRAGHASATVTFRQGVSPAGYAGAKDVYITDGADTPWNPDVNYNGWQVEVDTGESALMRWDLSVIPAGATISAASITLNVVNDSTQKYSLYECLKPWVDTQATWNQYATGVPWATAGANNTGTTSPDRGTTALNLDALTGAVGVHTYRLNTSGVAVVQKWLDNPSSNHGFVSVPGSNSDGFGWDDAESTTPTNRPRLNVTYSGPSGTVSLTFQQGVSPSSTYSGATDLLIISDTDPRTINHDTAGLSVDRSPDMERALLGFDLSAIPPWATVHGATLTLNVTNESTGTFSLQEVLQPWQAATATWVNYRSGAPWAAMGALGDTDRNPTVLGTIQPPTVGSYDIPLNAAGVAVVQAWVSGARPNNGFVLGNPTDDNGISASDSEDATAANRPGFTVNYTEGQVALTATDATTGSPAILTVERQRLDGTPIASGAPALDVTVSTPSPTGQFSASSVPNATMSRTLTVQIPAGASQSAPFYFFDASPGTPSISATAGAAWNDGTRSLVVIAPEDGGTDGGTVTPDGGVADGGTGQPDGGASDGGTADGGTADGGTSQEQPPLHLAVGCGATGSAPALGALGLLLLAVAWLRRRTR